MKKILTLFVFLTLLSGCASIESWKYTSEPKIYKKPDSNLTLVVTPLRDERINKNGTKASALLAMIPFVPYSTVKEFNIPESSPFLKFKPIEDFPKAISEEIYNASLFKENYFSDRTNDADLILTGTLKKSQIMQTWTFYGLSLPGDLLWLLGAPVGRTHNNIEIEFKLIDKNYKVYFEKNYTTKEKFNNGYWTNPHETFRFEKAFKRIALELVEDLRLIIPSLKK